MTQLKNIAISIILGLSAFFLFYLLGAFFNTSLDLKQWNETSRGLVAVFGDFFLFSLCIFAFICAFVFIHLDEN